MFYSNPSAEAFGWAIKLEILTEIPNPTRKEIMIPTVGLHVVVAVGVVVAVAVGLHFGLSKVANSISSCCSFTWNFIQYGLFVSARRPLRDKNDQRNFGGTLGRGPKKRPF